MYPMWCNLIPSSRATRRPPPSSLPFLHALSLSACALSRVRHQIPETLYLIQLVLEACVEAGASLLEIQVDRE
jgi:hypothetical protein